MKEESFEEQGVKELERIIKAQREELSSLNDLVFVQKRLLGNLDLQGSIQTQSVLLGQQEKIDELEQKLSLLENTGMIGVSPAQFMEKVRALESKLAKAVEALRGLYLLLQSEQYVKAHMEFFSKQDKRESYETGLANLAFNKDLAERLRFELLTAKKTLEEIGEQE